MITAILKLIEKGGPFVVASHEGPDGDAISSTLALTNALREMGHEVVAYNRDGLPDSYAFLPGAETLVSELPTDKRYAVGFVLDAGELRRAGSHLADCCDLLVNIDHHPFSERFSDYYLVDETACATGAMIHRILTSAQHPISEPVALCIYTAVLADTGSFRYSNANPEAFAIASAMVEQGVDPWTVAAGLYENQPEKRLRLLARALEQLTVAPCGRYASVSVTTEMLQQTDTGPEHTDGFVNYPRSIHGVEVGLFFRQLGPDRFKIGFRSKGAIDVGSLARALGGGGHHNAAGAEIQGDLEMVRTQVFTRLDELLLPQYK
ncbi:MAG: DHH family phosphoesterase [Desulfuromonas sp.]|nr:MAG: DHH family phosphoesterase [Desulfuromonas sp.]